METPELTTEVMSQQPAHAFDVFLSYSRKDQDFAIRLENALESYRFPKSLKGVKRTLNVFRDESDLEAAEDYHRTIEQHLKGSAKLVVVCSPDARRSKYVEDEVRRFIETHGDEDIIPVLVRGKANNETADESEKAFPEILCENRMPLAANFLGWDTLKGKLHRGPFRSPFYSVLAAINGIDRRRLEQVDERVRARRRALILSSASLIILVLSVALVFAIVSQRKAVAATNLATKSAEAEKTAKNAALASAEAEKKAKDEAVEAKNKAVAAARAEQKAKEEAVAAAEAEKKAKDEAVAAARAEEIAKNEAIAQRKAVERLLYTANINLAPQAHETGNIVRASELLSSLKPGGGSTSKGLGQGDLRGFEWFYLSGLYDRKLEVLDTRSEAPITAISPDGRLLAISGPDKVELLDVASQEKLATIDDRADVLTFSPDGKVLATGSTTGPFKLWDATTLRMLVTLKETSGAKVDQVAIAFSPSGRRIATSAFEGANGNRTYKVWDATSHGLIANFEILGKTPVDPNGIAVALSSDDRSIAIYTGSGIEVRDLASKRLLNRFPHDEVTQTMAFSPNGQTLMVGGYYSVRVLPLRDGQSDASFDVPRGFAPFVNASLTAFIVFSPDGRTFATGVKETTSSGGEVKLWESGSFKLLATFMGVGSHGEVSSLSFSSDGRILVVGGPNGIQLNNTSPDRNSSVVKTGQRIRSLAFSADSKRFVTLEWAIVMKEEQEEIASSRARAWDTATHQVLPVEPFAMKVSGNMALSPDGQMLAIGDPRAIRLWEISSHQLVGTIEMPERDAGVRKGEAPRRERAAAGAFAFAPDGRTIAVGLDDGSIQWWDIGQRRFLTEARKNDHGLDPDISIAPVRFSPNGKLLAALVFETDGNSIRIWDALAHKSLVRVAYGGQAEPICIAFSSDSKTLAVGLSDGTVDLLNLASLGERAKKLAGQRLSRGKIEPEGINLNLSDDKDRRRFVLAKLEGPVKNIYAVAFSADNKTIATGGEDSTVKLWSRSSYQQLLTLDAKIGEIYSLAFAPDNQTLLAGGDTGIAFWSARGNAAGPRGFSSTRDLHGALVFGEILPTLSSRFNFLFEHMH